MKNWRVTAGYIILTLMAVSMLYPFFAMINLSFVRNDAIFLQAGKVIYGDLTTENYVNVFNQIPLARYFFNSLLTAVITTVGQVIFSAMPLRD